MRKQADALKEPRMLVYYRVEAQQTLHVLVSLNAETGGCTEGVPNPGCLFIGHGPKTLPVTWLIGNQIINFSY
jgi:hypothetical protein